MIQRFTHTGFCVALLLCISLPVAAQTFGEITGSVTDSSGAVVAGATVTVTNTATAVERKVTTNEVGNYNVPFLNPGKYNLTAQLEGFKQASQREPRLCRSATWFASTSSWKSALSPKASK